MKLGVFDSGLGGLTVVNAIRTLCPNLDICYLGDTARVPYGNKSPETIARYAFECSRFLISQNVDAIVVACNSVTAIALPLLKEQCKVPVYGVIEPSAQAASGFSKVGLLATVATVQSRAYEMALRSKCNSILFANPAPLLVPLVEDGWSLGSEKDNLVRETVTNYLLPLAQAKIDVLILGCTHYPILKPVISDVLRSVGLDIPLIDSGEELAKELTSQKLIHSEGSGVLELYSTDNPKSFEQIAGTVLNKGMNKVSKIEL